MRIGKFVPVLTWLLLAVPVSVGAPQGQWTRVAKTSVDDMSIGRDSVIGVSKDVVSAWVQHLGADGLRTVERYEVNCTTQQRRLREVWIRPDMTDTAPVAQRATGWTPTERNTTMRELVVQVCAVWSRIRE